MQAVDGAARGVARVWSYRPGDTAPRDSTNLADVSELLAEPDTLVWVDILAPTPAQVALLDAECHLHPLAIEDVFHVHQRPKVDEYPNFYFVVFYAPALGPPVTQVEMREVDLFIGARYLITLHAHPVAQIEDGVLRWHENAADLGHDVGTLVYSLLDSMVDAYFPLLDELGDRVDEVQEKIFHRPTRALLHRLNHLRRDLLHIRRLLAPQREVLNTLLRHDTPVLPVSATVYFHDVYDHIVRLVDTVDTYRDLLASAAETYLSVTSNALNDVMKVLTAWSIILMSASLVAGVYGMNFSGEASPWNMPELRWFLGYPFALLLMVGVGGAQFVYFRRRGWL